MAKEKCARGACQQQRDERSAYCQSHLRELQVNKWEATRDSTIAALTGRYYAAAVSLEVHRMGSQHLEDEGAKARRLCNLTFDLARIAAEVYWEKAGTPDPRIAWAEEDKKES